MGLGNFIYVSIYIQVSDTPTHGHPWYGQWLCPRQDGGGGGGGGSV